VVLRLLGRGGVGSGGTAFSATYANFLLSHAIAAPNILIIHPPVL
jgi:hypothetical protein